MGKKGGTKAKNDVMIEVPLENPAQKSLKTYSEYERLIVSHNRSKRADSKPPSFIASSDGHASEFEQLMTLSDDNSAIISLVLRELVLACSEEFWTHRVDLGRIMRYHANDEHANVKNLFSILKHDWCDGRVSNADRHYFLTMKFAKFDENCSLGMFVRLCEIAEKEPQYGDVCSDIIDAFASEVNVNEIRDRLLKFVDDALTISSHSTRAKILKSLMKVTRMRSCGDDVYQEVKLEVTQAMKCSVKFDSVYKREMRDCEAICDEKFFELAFLLHEETSMKFQQRFCEFIATYKEFYGDCWEVAIKSDAKVLVSIAKALKQTRLAEFIRGLCGFVKIENRVFGCVWNKPLTEGEMETLDLLDFAVNECCSSDPFAARDFFDMFNIPKVNEKLVFGRKDNDTENMFEKIAANKGTSSVYEKVWAKFPLWDHPEFLMVRNLRGKTILSYILDSQMKEKLLAFFSIPNSKNANEFSRKRYAMLLNTQFCEFAQKSLVELVIELLEKNNERITLRKLLVAYLEEMGDVEVESGDSVVESLLMLERSEAADEILRMMISYWTLTKNSELRERIIKARPHFELLFLIKEGNVQDFIASYNSRMQSFENYVKMLSGYAEISIRVLNFNILSLAIKENQPEVINFILHVDSFENFETYLPETLLVNDIHQHTALTLLKKRNNINLISFPENWLSCKVLSDFLDSKLTNFSQQMIEMDLRFLGGTQGTAGKHGELDDKSVMFEDIDLLRYIEEKVGLNRREILVHPVIETFITLRFYKYRRIAIMNYFAFVFLFIIPFLCLIRFNHFSEKDVDYWTHIGVEKLHYVGIAYLLLRELLQLSMEATFLDHWRRLSNWFDLLLIAVAISVSVCSSNFHESSKWLEISEGALVLLTAVHVTSLIAHKKAPLYFTLLGKVTRIFSVVSDIFLYVILGLTLCFCIIFSGFDEKDEKEEEKSDEEKKPEESFSIFRFLFAGFVRILTMLSGEFSFEPAKLKFHHIIFFMIFVLVSFVLFNLIVGVALDEIGEIMREARQLQVLKSSRKIVEMSEKFQRCYAKRGYSQDRSSCGKSLLRYFLTRYEFIHHIGKIYIDKRTREVFVMINNKYEKIFKVHKENYSEDFRVDEEVFEAIREIMNGEKEKVE